MCCEIRKRLPIPTHVLYVPRTRNVLADWLSKVGADVAGSVSLEDLGMGDLREDDAPPKEWLGKPQDAFWGLHVGLVPILEGYEEGEYECARWGIDFLEVHHSLHHCVTSGWLPEAMVCWHCEQQLFDSAVARPSRWHWCWCCDHRTTTKKPTFLNPLAELYPRVVRTADGKLGVKLGMGSVGFCGAALG